ncbi:MAG: hypothetical protein H0S85_12475 [Desulfovibrionaceae bacterium]|jgi:hypothetical protein|nr:hypothetical protein [Desulfovibrionaceae bacterium]
MPHARDRFPRALCALCAVLACLATAPRAAWADAAPDPLNKGVRPYAESGRVRMDAERVDIVLGAERCRVAARFAFRNAADAAETLEVGFPSSYPHEITEVSVRIDGREVPVRESRELTVSRVQGPSGGLEDREVRTYWVLWDMAFAPGQRRVVDVGYAFAPSDPGDVVATPYTAHRFAVVEEFAAMGRSLSAEARAVVAAIDSRTAGYVLHTGRGWSESIGEAVISAAHPALGAAALRRIEPMEGAAATPGGVRWTYHGLEPAFDLSVEYNPRMGLDEELDLARAAAARHPDSRALRAYLNALQVMKSAPPWAAPGAKIP